MLVVAHKVVSKAEGRDRARWPTSSPASAPGRWPPSTTRTRATSQVVLDETAELVRADAGVLICATHHGFVCANAGVDASNAAERGRARPAARRSRRLGPGAARGDPRAAPGGVAPAVVIADSFGRAWREGQVDVAIGAAGLVGLDDWRGRTDAAGRPLTATVIAIADEVAAAADLVRSKDSRHPAVVVRGLGHHVTAEDGPGVAALLRDPEHDLFR